MRGKYYPDLSESDWGELLMGATCFPFGSPEMVERQVIELKEKTNGTLGQALAYADTQLRKAMEGK